MKLLLEFYQNFTFVYPDIQLDNALLPEAISYNQFSDAEIGKRVQTYFLKPFQNTFLKESPPIGVYQSDSDGTFLLKADYSKSQPISSTWYSLTNPLDSSTPYQKIYAYPVSFAWRNQGHFPHGHRYAPNL